MNKTIRKHVCTGLPSQQQLLQPSTTVGPPSHNAADLHDTDSDSDDEYHVHSRSVSKGLPKKGTWDELVSRYPIAVSAKDAKGISETIKQLTERLCTKRQNVLHHDTKWTDLKKSEVRDNAWVVAAFVSKLFAWSLIL